MKELIIVNSKVDTNQILLPEWESRLKNISNNIKKYTGENYVSLYNIGGEHMYNTADRLSTELELPLKKWDECSTYSQPKNSHQHELHDSMDRLYQTEKSTVIVTILNQQLSDLIGWWLKLPYGLWSNWELVTEQIGFHVLNINKSGDRTIYKFNES
ncbi:hypothetical protein [Paenibacillus sp. TSA_86.1]|uniref:hypothetical protein n=1 Tax=Paenibacillus sp. TSA_86.1 TaxID=3415649 RepID=UPI004045FFEA